MKRSFYYFVNVATILMAASSAYAMDKKESPNKLEYRSLKIILMKAKIANLEQQKEYWKTMRKFIQESEKTQQLKNKLLEKKRDHLETFMILKIISSMSCSQNDTKENFLARLTKIFEQRNKDIGPDYKDNHLTRLGNSYLIVHGLTDKLLSELYNYSRT